MAWSEPRFSRSRVDRAGRALACVQATEQDFSVINNWRSAHSFPLNTCQVNLRNRARRVDPRAITAQRLKRLSSIELKLRRFESMALSRMQDIGGCRAVLESVAAVRRCHERHAAAADKNPNRGSELLEPFDYISCPKQDGYRGIHLVYRYRTTSEARSVFNGLRIEIQLRSRLQHAWATAVETVDAFTGQALKFSGGELAWRRFFALMSSAIAKREGCPGVAGTPENPKELADELRVLRHELDVSGMLGSLGAAMDVPDVIPGDLYILVLDPKLQRIRVSSFKSSEAGKASETYLDTERQYAGSHQQVVLVSVESIMALKSAYPNYFADTEIFLKALRAATARRAEDS